MKKNQCYIDGCENNAQYKAPLSPDKLNTYIWFCYEHIKEYNKKWNYFSNMSADQIEEFIENDIIGHRKTKKMGTYSVDYAEKVEKIMDSLNSSYLGIDKNNLNPNLYSSKYLNALAVLGIDNKNASIEEIKSSFKKIVKELHPDTVGNDKSKTEKLTKVLESYKTLKEYYEQFKRPINK